MNSFPLKETFAEQQNWDTLAEELKFAKSLLSLVYNITIDCRKLLFFWKVILQMYDQNLIKEIRLSWLWLMEINSQTSLISVTDSRGSHNPRTLFNVRLLWL